MNQRFSFLVCMDRDLARKLQIFGIVLCLIGILGIVAPKLIAVAVSLVIAMMLILTGVVLCLFTYLTGQRDRVSWLKALSPLILGVFIALKPFALVVVLGLAIFIYFILDGVASITLALELKPYRGWLFLFVSGMVCLALAAGFIMFWPYSTHWYLGWMVGISLLMDGIFLLILSKNARECDFPDIG